MDGLVSRQPFIFLYASSNDAAAFPSVRLVSGRLAGPSLRSTGTIIGIEEFAPFFANSAGGCVGFCGTANLPSSAL
jgi:hypothetical protein